jgi:hypothetical protein
MRTRWPSRRELVTDCLFWGTCDRPVMGFLLEVQAFCWTGGCLCGRFVVSQSMPVPPTLCRICTTRFRKWERGDPGD